MATPDNPYDAPATDPGNEPSDRENLSLPLAGRGRRLLTFLVDYVGQMLLFIVLAVAAVLAWPALGDKLETMSKPMEWGLSLGVFVVYYVAFEALFARTPGKWICGTQVIDARGGPLSFSQAVGRTLARLVPFEPFSLLLSNDDDTSGWHDRWARTRVVRVR